MNRPENDSRHLRCDTAMIFNIRALLSTEKKPATFMFSIGKSLSLEALSSDVVQILVVGITPVNFDDNGDLRAVMLSICMTGTRGHGRYYSWGPAEASFVTGTRTWRAARNVTGWTYPRGQWPERGLPVEWSRRNAWFRDALPD